MKDASSYVKELNTLLSKYKSFTKQEIPELYKKNRGRKPPEDFVNSSFLYIRSYDNDEGVRPFNSNEIRYWRSPDISVAPVSDTDAFTRELDAGKSYQFNCIVRNKGDLIVPSAKVEFFMCDPTLGFDTRFATKIGVTDGWVNPLSSLHTNIVYTVPVNESGHKCLFARTFAFSPLDIPFDDYQLAPWIDRHVAQLNLHIVRQASSYAFSLVHLPSANEQIEFVEINANEIKAIRHPFLFDKTLLKSNGQKWMKQIKLKLIDQKKEGLKISEIQKGYSIDIKSPKGPSIEKQKELNVKINEAFSALHSGKANHSDYRELFIEFSNMKKYAVQTRFEIDVPNVALNKSEVIGINIINKNKVTGETKGGITLIITA